MALKIDKAIKPRALGWSQQPILDALKKNLPGSKAGYTALSAGRAELVVYWKGFDRHDVANRQKTVRDAIAKLGPEVPKLVALTPEDAGLDDEF